MDKFYELLSSIGFIGSAFGTNMATAAMLT